MPETALPDPPLQEAFAVTADIKETKTVPRLIAGMKWLRWFGDVSSMLNQTPRVMASKRLTEQAASIGVTPFSLGTVPPGLWRVTYNFRVSRAGTVSSSISLTITWTQGGQTMTKTTTAEAGNTLTTCGVGTIPVRPDAGTPISYSTTYATAGATPMQYELSLALEAITLDTE